MNATKTLTSIAAAAALVGTIGFASAQSSVDTMNSPATTPDSSTQVEASPAQVAPADRSTSTTTTAPASSSMDNSTTSAPASSTTDSGTTTTTNSVDNSNAPMDAERAPQADRN